MKISIMTGAVAAVGLMVAALWGWNRATVIGLQATHPEIVTWAVRSGAIAAAAAAQVLLLTFVVGALYRRDLFGNVLRLSAALVCTIALVSAVALGLAGR